MLKILKIKVSSVDLRVSANVKKKKNKREFLVCCWGKQFRMPIDDSVLDWTRLWNDKKQAIEASGEIGGRRRGIVGAA